MRAANWQTSRWMIAVPSLIAAVFVFIATRHDPLLSPDSITYLSAADHIRAGGGITDFTLKPLAVFGPLYPILLAPGGRSLVWATIVGAVAIAAGGALMWGVLQRRVRPIMAVGGALAFGASQGLVRMASTVWSEAPYAAISLAMLVVLSRRSITTRTAAVGGLLAGAGFLTRYAGVGLVMTGGVMVVGRVSGKNAIATGRSSGSPRSLPRRSAISSIWVIRNLVETGQALGPRFSGGANEPLSTTIGLAFKGTGHIVVGDGWSAAAEQTIRRCHRRSHRRRGHVGTPRTQGRHPRPRYRRVRGHVVRGSDHRPSPHRQ